MNVPTSVSDLDPNVSAFMYVRCTRIQEPLRTHLLPGELDPLLLHYLLGCLPAESYDPRKPEYRMKVSLNKTTFTIGVTTFLKKSLFLNHLQLEFADFSFPHRHRRQCAGEILKKFQNARNPMNWERSETI